MTGTRPASIISGNAPALGALTDGDTLSDAVTWGSGYASLAGSIVEPTTKQMRLDAGAWETYDGDTTVAAGDAWTVREIVSDDAGTDPRTFTSNTVSVSGIAPTVEASDDLLGRELTITVGATTGSPIPTVRLTSLTLDGDNVLDDATGDGPWSYAVPSSVSAQTVAWTVTASNMEGDDTASGSETVSADQSAPTISVSDGLAGRDLTITVDSSSGTPSPSIELTTITLNGEDVLGDVTGSGPWTYSVPSDYEDQTVAWIVTATNAVDSDTSSGSEVIPADLFKPAAAGGISDQSWSEGEAIAPLDVSADFTGTAPITYALAPGSAALPTGPSLSSAGLITGTPTTAAAEVNIIVRGTNAGGYDDTAFGVTVVSTVAKPSPFTFGMWDLTDAESGGTLIVTINSLPAANGATITDVEYRVDGGSWVSSEGTVTFNIPSLTDGIEYDVELRAVNSVDPGDAGDLKSAEPTTASGGAFTPADLFSTEEGFSFDIQDPSTMNTKSDLSGSVPGVGDPVGYIEDQSGNGRHATQPTDAKRPLLQQSGGLYYLDLDGVNDFLIIPLAASGGAAEFEFYLAYEAADVSASTIMGGFYDYNKSYLYSPYIAPGPEEATRIAAGGGTSILGYSPISSNTPYIYQFEFDQGSYFSSRHNGTLVGTRNSFGSDPLGNVYGIFLGARNKEGSADLFTEGRIYGATGIQRILGTTEKEDMEDYMSDVSGATL